MRETAICPLFKRSAIIITLSGICKALAGGNNILLFKAVQMLDMLQWLMNRDITWATFIVRHIVIKVIILKRK